MAYIFFEGCSVTYGYYGHNPDGTGADFVTLHKQHMMNEVAKGKPAHEVINLARSSQSLDQIVTRFPGKIEAYGRGRSRLGVFLLGGPDSLIRKGESQPRVPLEQFKILLTQLGEACLKQSVVPLYLIGYGVDESRTNPFPKNGDTFSNEQIFAYHAVIESHAKNTDSTVVRLRPAFEEYPIDQVLASDGMHPNSFGHELMFRTTLPYIQSLVD